MAENLGSLGKFYVGVGVDLSELRAGMTAAVGQVKNASDVIRKSTENISGGFKNATQTAIGFAAGMAGLQGLQSIFEKTVGAGWNFNSMMQQSMISFKTMLGGSEEAANKLLNDLYQMAATTSFEFPELTKSAKQMMAMGFEAEKLIPTLTAIGDAASGLGLGSEGIERIVRALGQMQMKGKVSGEEMRQLAEAGIPAWDILAKAMGKSTGEVMKLSEKGLIPAKQAVDALVDGMEQRFPGMMEAQSKTFSGLMSTLRDGLNQIFGQIMKPLFEDFSTNVLPKLVDKVSEFSDVLTKKGLQEALKTIFPPGLVDAAVAGFNALGVIIQFVREHAVLFQAVLTAIVAGFIAYNAAIVVSNVLTTASAVAYAAQTGSVGLATTGLLGLRLANIAATISTVAQTFATQGLTAAFRALALAMSINPIVLAVTLALGALTLGITYFTAQAKKAREEEEKLVKTTKENAQTSSSLIAEYKELSNKTQQTAADKARLVQISDKLAKILPDCVDGYTKEGHALINFNAALQEAVKLKQKELELEAQAAQKRIEKLKDQKTEIENQISLLQYSIKTVGAYLQGKELQDHLKKDNVELQKQEALLNNINKRLDEQRKLKNQLLKDAKNVTPESILAEEQAKIDKSKNQGSGSKTTTTTKNWDLGAGVTNKSAFDLAKDKYDMLLAQEKRNAAERLALYKEVLGKVKKDAAEELEYKKGLYQAEREAAIEQLDLKKAALDKELLDDKLTAEQKYEKRKQLLQLDLQEAEGDAVRKAQIENQLAQLEIERTNEVRDAKLAAAARERDLAKQQLDFMNGDIEYQRSLGLISATKELQLKRQTMEEKYALDRADLEGQRSKYAEGTEEYKNYTNQLLLLDNQYQRDILENERATFREKNKMWFDMVQNVGDSVKQCTVELINGTMSWKQAFASVGNAVKDTIINAFADMVADWIKKLGIMLIQYIAHKMGIKAFQKTSDTVDKSTAVAAATAETAAVSGVKAAAAAKDILQAKLAAKMVAATGAAEAYAVVGATAAAITACLTMLTGMASAIAAIFPVGTAMAPAMFAGIGAATAALAGASAAATAGITAAYAPVLAFDQGTWSVPSDMLAQIHKGEVIVPEKFSDKARQVLSGEGTGQSQPVNVNYNVNAIDAKGVKAMLHEHGRVIVDVIKEQNRNFAFSNK
jgi:tape measure domain-containing protein